MYVGGDASEYQRMKKSQVVFVVHRPTITKSSSTRLPVDRIVHGCLLTSNNNPSTKSIQSDDNCEKASRKVGEYECNDVDVDPGQRHRMNEPSTSADGASLRNENAQDQAPTTSSCLFANYSNLLSSFGDRMSKLHLLIIYWALTSGVPVHVWSLHGEWRLKHTEHSVI